MKNFHYSHFYHRTSAPLMGVAFLAVWFLAGSASATALQTNRGESIFTNECIACHSPDGVGTMPGIPDLSGKEGPLSKPDEVLLKSILSGVETASTPIPMPPIKAGELSAEEKARLVLTFIRSKFGN